MKATKRKLDFAERWLNDGLNVCRAPAFFARVDVDMTAARQVLAQFRARGIRLSYVHLMVYAGARALSAHPDLHRMLCGNRVYRPASVRIALSVAGELPVSPVLAIDCAERKSLDELVAEVSSRVPGVRENDQKLIAALRRWGWIVPFGAVRRAILRLLFRNAGFRYQGTGSLQISVLREVDIAVSPVFSATAALYAGGVRDRVIAVDGQAAVRPTMILACSADHRVWDGRAGERFLITVRDILESDLTELKSVAPPSTAQEPRTAVF